MKCEYLDIHGYCHHPDLGCVQECGIILDNNCGLIKQNGKSRQMSVDEFKEMLEIVENMKLFVKYMVNG